MMKRISKTIPTIGLASLLSCGPTLATRQFEKHPERGAPYAYQDMRDILKELCYDFQISPQSFRCLQFTSHENPITSQFRWDEIETVQCQGRAVQIIGKYDSSAIYTRGPMWQDTLPQCQDLAEAMKVYLKARER